MPTPLPFPRAGLGASVLATLVAAALAPAAFAGEEYAATSFAGGFADPPADATTQIGPGQDDLTKTVALPFEFPFFGRLTSQVSVCSNGWLAFGTTTAATSANAALPDAAAPNGIVAALWDDLTTGTGAVKTFTTGTAPARVFTVAWDHVDTFSGLSNDDLSFQVRLHETSGVVEIAYAPGGTWDGLSYTAGIEDPSGTVAFGAGGTGDTNSGQPTMDWRFTPRAVPVSGSLLRERPVADAGGLGPDVETGLPVVGADVELVREDTGEVAARGRTAEGGGFSVAVLGVDAPATLALDLLASGAESRVVGATGTVYRHRIAAGISVATAPVLGTIMLDASADAADPAIRKAVNVQQAARRGFAWAQAAAAFSVQGTNPAVAAETFPRLDFKFVPGTSATGGRTLWYPATATTAAVVQVEDGALNPDPWDDDVILRECGQHVLATISEHTQAIGTRSWRTSTTLSTAWADGFAHWFACVVQGRAAFVDTKTASTADTFDLESGAPEPKRAPDVTGAVATSLWDLVDPANEHRDDFEGAIVGDASTALQVFRAIDLGMDAAPAGTTFDVASFFDAWRSGGPAEDRRATARVFILDGGFADDTREADDTLDEARVVSGTQRVDGLVLSKFNDDVFSVTFAPEEEAPLVVAVTQTTTADLEVEVLDASSARVAFATSVGAASRARVTAASAGPLPAGTYTVRVSWLGGSAGSYSLAFFEPLALATASLPSWTVGQPFKVTLTAAGGIPPYTIVPTVPVPGLATTASGTEISGTPVTAGEYVVHVVVTDASGAGTQATADLPLTVNGVLAVVPLLGVPAGEDVDVAIGTGGTESSWTPATAGDGALEVVGGPTLRVAGETGSPRTFTVAGSAADIVGAVLPATSSRIVVCPPLPATGAATVAAGSHFGFGFEGVAGSLVDLKLKFSGVNETPTLTAIVDPAGVALDLTGHVSVSGRTIRLQRLPLPATGRWYAVFTQKPNAFVGTLSVGGRVKPPADQHGVAVLDDGDAVVPVPFEAIAGSRIRLDVLPERIPDAPQPQIFGLLDPAGTSVDLPAPRRLRGSGGMTVGPVGPLATSGTWTLRVAGDGVRTGPVFWRVRTKAPKKRTFWGTL